MALQIVKSVGNKRKSPRSNPSTVQIEKLRGAVEALKTDLAPIDSPALETDFNLNRKAGRQALIRAMGIEPFTPPVKKWQEREAEHKAARAEEKQNKEREKIRRVEQALAWEAMEPAALELVPTSVPVVDTCEPIDVSNQLSEADAILAEFAAIGIGVNRELPVAS